MELLLRDLRETRANLEKALIEAEETEMPEYIVHDRDGARILREDEITNFRGEPGIFERVTRGPEGGRTPKVVVNGREYYANAWGLTVTVWDGVER